MATTNIYSDQSRQVNWVVRQNTDVTLTLTVTESAVAYDLSSSTFIAEVFKIGNETAILTLTQGSGITNGGVTGILTLSLTNTQLNITADQYWWRLRTTAPTDYVWFNGVFDVNNYLWDGNANASASIALTIGNTNVDLALTVGGADSLATLGTTLQTAATDTPLDADTFSFYDAVDAILKKVSWTNIKATLKTYFDTLYETITKVQNSTTVTAVVSGTDTYTATLTPDITAYVTGQTFKLTGITANTVTNPTINFNDLGAKNLVTYKNEALTIGDFAGVVIVTYDGTSFRMIGGGGGTSVGSKLYLFNSY